MKHFDYNNYIDSISRKYIPEEKKQNEPDVIWENENELLTFEEFCVSSDHMNFSTLSARQLALPQFVFGIDPKKVFENGNYLGIWELGKGCLGEDTILEDVFLQEKHTVKEWKELNRGIHVQCIDDNYNIRYSLSEVPFLKGFDKLYEVKTESGKSVTVQLDHKFKTKDGWIALKDLHINDEILDDYKLKCKLCNKEFEVINSSHTKNKHNMELIEYFKIDEDARKAYAKFCSHPKEKHPRWGQKWSEEWKKNNREKVKKSINELYASERGKILIDKMKKTLNDKYAKMSKEERKKFGQQKEKHWKWRGGLKKHYGVSFEIAKIIYKRDNHTCRMCSKKAYGKDSSVHHINYISDDDRIENLVLLCRHCHNKTTNAKGEKRIYYKQLLSKDNSCLKWDKITSIEFVKYGNYYDLEVPIYHNYLAHGLYHHNSGKDKVISLMFCYMAFILMHMKSPQRYFKSIADNDPITFLNVATTAGQASSVFFEYFRQSVLHWPWLLRNYKVKFSGIYISNIGKSKEIDLNAVNVVSNAIIFPKNIIAISGHADSETFEGKNILCFALDEVAGFKTKGIKTPDKMFRMLTSSAETRFGNRYKGFIFSFPRYRMDFIQQLRKAYESDLHVYTDKATTFEMKPRHMFQKEEFRYECEEKDDEGNIIQREFMIPMDFYNTFQKDPMDAKRKILCIPPDVETPFFENFNLYTKYFDDSIIPLLEMEDFYENGYVMKKIRKWNVPFKSGAEYIICIDLGLSDCATGLSIIRKDGEKVFVDFVTRWKPIPEKNIVVSFINVEQIIYNLIEYLKIRKVIFDRWNSVTMVQKFKEKQIDAEIVSLGEADYKKFKSLFYSGMVRILRNEDIIQEMNKIQLLAGTEVGSTGHKDIFDTIVTGTKVLLMLNKGVSKPNKRGLMIGDGEIIKHNLNTDFDDMEDTETIDKVPNIQDVFNKLMN